MSIIRVVDDAGKTLKEYPDPDDLKGNKLYIVNEDLEIIEEKKMPKSKSKKKQPAGKPVSKVSPLAVLKKVEALRKSGSMHS